MLMLYLNAPSVVVINCSSADYKIFPRDLFRHFFHIPTIVLQFPVTILISMLVVNHVFLF